MAKVTFRVDFYSEHLSEEELYKIIDKKMTRLINAWDEPATSQFIIEERSKPNSNRS